MMSVCSACRHEHSFLCHPASVQKVQSLLQSAVDQQEQHDLFASTALGVAVSSSTTALSARNSHAVFKNFLVAPTMQLPTCGVHTDHFQFHSSIIVQSLLDSHLVILTKCPTMIVKDIAHFGFGYIVQCAHCHCDHHTPILQGQFHC